MTAKKVVLRLDHAEREHVSRQDRLMLLALFRVLLAQPHDRAQRLDVEAVGPGLRIDVADVVRDGLLLFLEPLDTFHECAQVLLGDAGRGSGTGFGSSGRDVGHGFSSDRANAAVPAASHVSEGTRPASSRGEHHPQAQCLPLAASNAARWSGLASRWYFAFHSSYGMP